jgi:hypothetical protein
MINNTEKLMLDMCKMLIGSGTTVNMDNYYTSTITAMKLLKQKKYCCGTIQSNRKFVPKSILFTSSEANVLPRGFCRSVVNPDHNIIAVGWLGNKAVDFISTADTTSSRVVKRRVPNKKVEIPAPEVVCKYNKYMGGVDKHDKLRSTFSLCKQHKFKKYYVKLLLFLLDVALTNSTR